MADDGEDPHHFTMRLLEFLGEAEFEEALMTFLNENAAKVGLSNHAEEQSLEVYGIYRSYLETVEKVLGSFREREGVTDEEFQARLAKAKATHEGSSRFIDAILASWEFDAFMELVTDFLMESDDEYEDGGKEEGEGEGGAHGDGGEGEGGGQEE